jgi:hypothetical protein
MCSSPYATHVFLHTIVDLARCINSVSCTALSLSLSRRAAQQQQQREPDPLPVLGAAWAQELVGVASCLEQLGLGTASEEAYTRVINRWGQTGRRLVCSY